ncbi:UNKNOWN [Stylonychia lemnae]|uniref:Uncharacterized protein n=1 Tax=Stylonychia lemnae TaxID=5949 RepID=A0A077ZVI4_STYLE|nr:UNKNOWN [Stylonychia lemnae]|eukprot:CDW73295.1 UNKNOWN [Stylonychia lemnae]
MTNSQVQPSMNFNYRNRQSNYHYQQQQPNLLSNYNSAVGQVGRERKLKEREDRIRREKEELEKLESYNPFGKGGAGAPFKDRDGNIISNRRPFSQIREPGPALQNSQSNKNIYQPINSNPYNAPMAYDQKSNLNQSIDVGQLHMNYYQNAQNIQSKSPSLGAQQYNNPPAKITSLESADQREQRQRKQLDYQEVLRQQMEEKKAKEEAAKRKRMEEDMRQEIRIKEEIEREKIIQQQEKMKKEQQQNQYKNQEQDNTSMNAHSKHKNVGKVGYSPVTQSSKGNNLPPPNQQQQLQPQALHEQKFLDNGFNRQMDMLQFNNQMQQPASMNSYQQSNPGQGGYGIINNSNHMMFNQMENNLQSEIQKLKTEMFSQQKQFDNQLLQLREEAQRNIEYRVKAEQELQRVKLNSQRDSQRPIQSVNQSSHSQRDASSNIARRSMAGINNYEKMFFGNNNLDFGKGPLNQNSNLPGIGSGGLNFSNPLYQGLKAQNEAQNQGNHFNGSISLKAESTFVPVNSNFNIHQQQFQQQEMKLNEFKSDIIQHQPSIIQTQSQQLVSKTQSQYDQFDGDLSLNYLESAINEISELNMGENYKVTQKALEDARKETQKQSYNVESDQDYHDQNVPSFENQTALNKIRQQSRPISREVNPIQNQLSDQVQPNKNQSIIPDYKGIQDDDDEINSLAYQINQVNNAQAQNKQHETEEIRKEYLMRQVQLGPILESSNEHTMPSMGLVATQNQPINDNLQ